MTQYELKGAVEQALIEERKQLKFLQQLSKRDAPEGHLFTYRGLKRNSYWRVPPKSNRLESLDPGKPRDAKMIERLAEKSVLRRGIPRLEKNVKALERFLASFDIYDPRNYPNGELVKSDFCLPGETDWAKWTRDTKRGNYRTNPKYPEHKIFGTLRGDAVRSKSEAMIADYYHHLEWLYRYEGELIIGGKAVYPDFQFLHPVSRELIVHEHFGSLHRAGYPEECLWKLSTFAEDGFRLGRNSIMTWETQEDPLTLERLKTALRSIGIQ